jgi:hypothetical protein
MQGFMIKATKNCVPTPLYVSPAEFSLDCFNHFGNLPVVDKQYYLKY